MSSLSGAPQLGRPQAQFGSLPGDGRPPMPATSRSGSKDKKKDKEKKKAKKDKVEEDDTGYDDDFEAEPVREEPVASAATA